MSRTILRAAWLLLGPLLLAACGPSTSSDPLGEDALIPDRCSPNPCANGASCRMVGEAFACDCPAGSAWQGLLCDSCPPGRDAACAGCAAGYVPLGDRCVNKAPCSAAALDGRCPAGATCDGELGYCALDAPEAPCGTALDGAPAGELVWCAALRDEGLIGERGGAGLPRAQWLAHFAEVWQAVDQRYGGFDAAGVDWRALGQRYRAVAEGAQTRYLQTYLLTNLLGELHDTHTAYVHGELCQSMVALPTGGSPFPLFVSEIAGELYVYYSEDERVIAGDRLVSVNGLSGGALRGYWRERLKCTSGFSSEAIEQESFERSVLGLVVDPLFVGSELEPLLHAVFERSDGARVLLRPADAGDRWVGGDWGVLSYYAEGAPIELSFEPYDTGQWGGGRQGYLGHAWHGDLAILVFYNFLGEDDLARAIGKVVQRYQEANGWVIDVRLNSGGGPHHETLTRLLAAETVHRPESRCKRVSPDHDDLYPCDDERGTAIDPDDRPSNGKPVAVLTSGYTVSAGDHFAYLMKQASNARLFGQPTAGAFGNVSIYPFAPEAPYQMSITWTEQTDAEARPLQGRSVVPDVALRFSREDIVAGVDTLMQAAIAWLEGQTR